MSQKTAEKISQDDIAAIDSFLQSLPEDPTYFQKMFPHDQKIEVPW
jgi:hypothetical protein